MADYMYAKTLEDLLSGLINLSTDPIKALLCGNAYSGVAGAANPTLADIPTITRFGVLVLTGKVLSLGTFAAANGTFPASPPGNQITQVIFFKDTSVESTSRLLAHVDSYAGIPMATGVPITVNFPVDANKIFRA